MFVVRVLYLHSILLEGKAPFASLLEGIRSAQKTEFEKMCTEKEAEVSPVLYYSVFNGCCTVLLLLSLCVPLFLKEKDLLSKSSFF